MYLHALHIQPYDIGMTAQDGLDLRPRSAFHKCYLGERQGP